jgi:hypothetical protein
MSTNIEKMNGWHGGDDESRKLLSCVGKTIDNVRMTRDVLKMDVAGVGTLAIWDDGQDCCESRYMRTDDDLASFNGATLIDVETRDAPSITPAEDESECHEVQFLVVHTSKGDITLSTHNEHNGYYGGFNVRAEVKS